MNYRGKNRFIIVIALFCLSSSFASETEAKSLLATCMHAIVNTSKFVYLNATPNAWQESVQESIAIKNRIFELDQEIENYDSLRKKYVGQLKELVPPQEQAVEWYFNAYGTPAPIAQEAYDRWCEQIAEHAEAKKIAVRLVGVTTLRIKTLKEWSALNRALPLGQRVINFSGYLSDY